VTHFWAGGYAHSGVVLSNGDAYGWGWAKHGQLGGDMDQESVAEPRLLAHDVATVCSGSFKHTVLHFKNGTVGGMGSNAFFQIRGPDDDGEGEEVKL
jgi:alpha-tubulin suppressor-like RCC1 family protein